MKNKGLKYRIMKFMSGMMITCENASWLISKKQNERLSLKDSFNLKMHLFACYLCRRYEKEIRFLTEAHQKLLDENNEFKPFHLSAEQIAKLKDAISEESHQ